MHLSSYYASSWQDNVKANGELSKILESTRSRLISQLHCKEDENDRLIAQIQVSRRDSIWLVVSYYIRQVVYKVA